MGLDLVDIKLRVEREFNISIENRSLGYELLKLVELSESAVGESGGRIPRDITVAQLFSIVCNRIYWQHGSVPNDAWPRFVRCVQAVLAIDAGEIVPTAYLNRDLGMD